MKKLKKMLSLVCVLCVLMNVLVVGAMDEHIDAGEMIDINTNRTPVLALSIGSGKGQVAYGGNPYSGYEGPDAFAVENGAVYILDAHNDRIVVWKNKQFLEFEISACPNATHMRYQNGRIGLVDNDNGVTGVYSAMGDLIISINHPEKIKKDYVSELMEVGEHYVVWKTYGDSCYRYDWSENELSVVDASIKFAVRDEDVVSVSSTETSATWKLDLSNKDISVLGVKKDVLFYQQYEIVPNVDLILAELSVRKISADGTETYAIINSLDWYMSALEPFYLSSEGNVYVMECFEDKVVISEVSFRQLDSSYMTQLESMAADRREEMQAVDTHATITTTTEALRSVVLSRARSMVEMVWTVQNHNATTNNGLVIIPSSVTSLAPGGTYTGIPYCWGGANGLDNIPMGTGFSQLLSSGQYTTGNTYCNPTTSLQPNTIGVDCVGFVCSAYRFSTSTKPLSSDFVDFKNHSSIQTMKPMDLMAKNGHVALFLEKTGTKIGTYEALVLGGSIGNDDIRYLDGKTKFVEREYSDVIGVYYARTPFCLGCDKVGTIGISTEGHIRSCSGCGYVWPAEVHVFVNGKCSVCGYIE